MADAASLPDCPILNELQAAYPEARLVEVTREEYHTLVAMNGNAVDVHTAPPAEKTTYEVEPETRRSRNPRWWFHRPPPERGTVVSARVNLGSRVGVSAHGMGTGSISTDDLAVILYVLLGAVVVAVAVFYGGFILYEMMTGIGDYQYWAHYGAGAWHFTGSGRKGGMYGGRISTGLVDERNRVGLLLEAGYIDGRFRFRDGDGIMSVHGVYGLLGPTVQWAVGKGPNPTTLDAEILTGYSTANRVGLMSRATGGLSWGLGSRGRLGLQLGSTYAKIRETEGPLTTKSNFNFTVGGWMGASF